MDRKKVIIIGAGPSGLYAAQELKKKNLNIDIIIVEATNRVGGRILSYQLNQKFPESETHVEFGPEFVHGESNNLFIDLVNKKYPDGSALLELDYPNYFYFGKEGKFQNAEDAMNENPELSKIFQLYDELEELDAGRYTTDKSLLQHFTEEGVSSRFLDIADAIYANDYGADLSQIGLKETIVEQQEWNYGEKYLVLRKGTFTEIIQQLAVGLDIRNNWVVSEIDYRNKDDIKVTNQNGETMTANRVIVTVPISVLQRSEIKFNPSVELERKEAWNSVKLANAMKIAVVVNRKFWPNDFYDAVCSDSFVPEIWLTPAATALQSNLSTYTMIGFITGDRANRVCNMDENEVKRLFLNQLDSIFGSVDQPTPASSSCVGFFMREWSKEPFFYGAYTYPTLGAYQSRNKMAKPLSNCVFFSGEATHTGINPCVHGAFETAVRATNQLIQSLNISKL